MTGEQPGQPETRSDIYDATTDQHCSSDDALRVENGQATDHAPSTSPLLAIVEDNEDIRDALAEGLRDAGYRVAAYGRAREALEDMDRGRRPDLIVLDLMMPEMDGWSFRLEQRKRPHLREIPVIAVSADVSPKARAIDVDAYLRKPIELGRLCTVVDQLLAANARKQVAQKGIELERLRSLGMLVASVAHEVNNPLTAVTGYLDLCTRHCERARGSEQIDERLADQVVHCLDAARAGTERIASIIRLLLTFARADEDGAPKLADPVRALDAALSLAHPELRRKARLVRQVEELPQVAIPEAKLAQVFLNLLVNAAHAIEPGHAEDHSIEVCTRVQEGFAVVEISDTGAGIAPELADRIFEPFFSTKPEGQGTGLGLSIALDIVRAAGGSIDMQSRQGQGTTFRVRIPAVSATVEGPPSMRSRSGVVPRSLSPTYRILVVDDEPLVGQMLTAMLDQHEVHFFSDAREALEAVDEMHFDLILCDWFMPRMTGGDFYRELVRRAPQLRTRFVLMTGAAPSEALDNFTRDLIHQPLRKPFKAQELERSIARVVAQQTAAELAS